MTGIGRPDFQQSVLPALSAENVLQTGGGYIASGYSIAASSSRHELTVETDATQKFRIKTIIISKNRAGSAKIRLHTDWLPLFESYFDSPLAITADDVGLAPLPRSTSLEVTVYNYSENTITYSLSILGTYYPTLT